MTVFIILLALLGGHLCAKRALESFHIGDWWGVLGQAFILFASWGVMILALLIYRNL